MQAFKSAILAIIGKSQVLIQVDNLRRLPRLGYAIGPLWDLLAKPCLMVLRGAEMWLYCGHPEQ